MKTVTLFRHAKSGEKGNPRIHDFDRPLSNRGLKAAPKMGAAMRERHLRPTLILCSPSVRTLQTLTLASTEACARSCVIGLPTARFSAVLLQ